MLRETCQECERLRREFDEAVQKTLRLEERLRHARDCQDHEQVEALAGRLAFLAEEMLRINSLLRSKSERAAAPFNCLVLMTISRLLFVSVANDGRFAPSIEGMVSR